jgi:hypothetical protein
MPQMAQKMTRAGQKQMISIRFSEFMGTGAQK